MGAATATTAIWEMHAGRWSKAITAKNLSPLTRRGYLGTAKRWYQWLAAEGYDIEPADVRPYHVDEFVADVIGATSASNGAHHYRNLRVFLGWLAKRESVPNPMAQTEHPRVPEKITPLLSDEEHMRVLAVCGGSDFASRRDAAIVLLFIDTGLRVSELASLLADDVDLRTRRFTIRGKGGKVRAVGFGNSTGLALARYLKERTKAGVEHRELWLSSRGYRPFTVDGLKAMLGRRGRQAKVSGSLHAHRFRHDFSHRWQDAGGSEHGLMLIAGWSSTKMARHYGKQAAAQRALAEQERLSLADRIDCR